MVKYFPTNTVYLLQEILLGEEVRLIGVFIDGLLSCSESSNEVIKQCGNRIHDYGKDSRITLHITGGEVNANITGLCYAAWKKQSAQTY
jgi:hypothetical protein